MCLDENYKDYFIKNLHDALSGHCSNNVEEAVRYVYQQNIGLVEVWHSLLLGFKSCEKK